MTWAGPEAATTSGAQVMDLGPGASNPEVLGLDRLEGLRPHCGPSGQGARSALE
jgi:hypothetical protein